MRVIIYDSEGGPWSEQTPQDQFDVPGEIVEVRIAGLCEMTFVMADGTEINAMDIPFNLKP